MHSLKIKVVIGILTIVGLFHLLRLAFRAPVTIGAWAVPLYFSGIALVVIGALIIWLIRR